MSASSSITLRQWLPLLGLVAAVFIFNTSEFIPVGLLLDIGHTYGITEAQTGIMISVYAWGVMILSMPLMVLSSRFGFKTLLLSVMGLLTAGQFLSAIAPTFPFLVASRLVTATAHAVFWSIASIIATRLVDPNHRSFALSLIAAGTSVAMILGIPLGRTLGLSLGWRMTFGVVGIVSALVMAYLAVTTPKMKGVQAFSFREVPRLMRNPVLLSIYGVTIFLTTGYYAAYSYIEPFMEEIAQFSPPLITKLLMVFGIAGMTGSLIFSKVYDKQRVGFTLSALSGIALSLLLMRVSTFSPIAVFGVIVLWGMSSTAFSIALQSELIRYTTPSESAVAMSIYSGLYNFGIGTGTAIGGLVTTHFSLGDVGYFGGVLAAVGVALAASCLSHALHSCETPAS